VADLGDVAERCVDLLTLQWGVHRPPVVGPRWGGGVSYVVDARRERIRNDCKNL